MDWQGKNVKNLYFSLMSLMGGLPPMQGWAMGAWYLGVGFSLVFKVTKPITTPNLITHIAHPIQYTVH